MFLCLLWNNKTVLEGVWRSNVNRPICSPPNCSPVVQKNSNDTETSWTYFFYTFCFPRRGKFCFCYCWHRKHGPSKEFDVFQILFFSDAMEIVSSVYITLFQCFELGYFYKHVPKCILSIICLRWYFRSVIVQTNLY